MLAPIILARIFHTKSITACGKLIITVLVSNCDLSSMCSCSPASQSFARLVLISFARRLMTLQYEISGLARLFHTDSAAACEHLMDTASASNYSSGSRYTALRQNTRLPCPVYLRSSLVTISVKCPC
jgi:hypothetical protein